MEITSLDLSILENEFKELEGGHVQKVYQRKTELTVEIYVPGEDKKRLVIGPDRAFISKYKRDNPKKPPGFCMELRKHLGKVDSITQEGFDRILVIKSGDIKLICEMFGKGNFILTKEGKIIGALREEKWADREIRVGLEYKFPEPTKDPRGKDVLDMLQEGEVVRRIASDLSFGGTYAEEICTRIEIEKNKSVSELTQEERKELKTEIANILDLEVSPRLYIKDMPIRASPFKLETYSENEFEEFESFSNTIDEYYYRREKREEERKLQKKYEEELDGLKNKKNQQERKIQGLKKSSKQNRRKAELIYENYNELEEAKSVLEDAIDEHGWKKTQEIIENAENDNSDKIKTLNEQNKFFSYKLNEADLKIQFFQDLEATASEYYDKAKNSESKMESAEKALEQTRKEISELEKKDIELKDVGMEDKSQKRNKKWFEKYRWFFSSDNHLVIIGRDAQTNEMAVNKHMEDNDLYMHVDFDGAPSVIIKDGKNAPETTLKQAGQAAVTFTKSWKAGIGAADVYYVEPDQVTKNPESGEYLTKGAFVIRGDREYLRNIKIDASVGPYEIEEDLYVPMCGPSKAVEEQCPEKIDLRPGNIKKSEISKKINNAFKKYDLDLDYIVRSLPPGKSEIDNQN